MEGWLKSLKVTNFQKLKNLLITYQIRERAPQELKDQLIDVWSNIIDPEALDKRLDELEVSKKS